jgi:hypothetical protein
MHKLPVGGTIIGGVFVVGTSLIFLIGIPAMRWFLAGAVIVGAIVARVLYRWHKSRPVEITDLEELEERRGE